MYSQPAVTGRKYDTKQNAKIKKKKRKEKEIRKEKEKKERKEIERFNTTIEKSKQ